jgi:hypothetical protein
MYNNTISHKSIYGIESVSVKYIGGGQYVTIIIYDLNSAGSFKEEGLFPSKEELIKSL